MKESGLGGLVFPDGSSQATCTYRARNTHSARDRACFCSHFLRMCRSEDVGDCRTSAASNRKSRRSCLADSRRSLVTSDIETTSPRPSVMNSLASSRNSRRESETRIDRVCC